MIKYGKVIGKMLDRLSDAIDFKESAKQTTMTEKSKKNGDRIDPYPKMSKEEFAQGKKEVMDAYNSLNVLFETTLSNMEKNHRGQKE